MDQWSLYFILFSYFRHFPMFLLLLDWKFLTLHETNSDKHQGDIGRYASFCSLESKGYWPLCKLLFTWIKGILAAMQAFVHLNQRDIGRYASFCSLESKGYWPLCKLLFTWIKGILAAMQAFVHLNKIYTYTVFYTNLWTFLSCIYIQRFIKIRR